MIPVRRPRAGAALDLQTRCYLDARQFAARTWSPGDPQISAAWANFLRTPARQRIATALDDCFHSKCAYCEQVAAKDIEHFFPKSAYPNRMFRWDNFLRGCKNCNNAKRDQFPTFRRRPLLLDPCTDDPLDYFAYDFATGVTGINSHPDRIRRGMATRDLFQLDQEPLREERRIKLSAVTYLLARVVEEEPVTRETRIRLQQELLPSRPWLAIVRSLFRRDSDYTPLVRLAREKLPEIEDWVSTWI